jgi:hypothetical protein
LITERRAKKLWLLNILFILHAVPGLVKTAVLWYDKVGISGNRGFRGHQTMRKRAFILVLILIPALLTAAFLGRRPVILVGDDAFNMIYGERRALISRWALSLRLFRWIKTINVSSGVGPDLVAQAAASLSRRPEAVFFPYRYREGARRYLKNRPGPAVVILGGRNPPDRGVNEGPEPLWIVTDTGTDLYRAGAAAGIITGNSGMPTALYYEKLEEAGKTAFIQGLRDQGYTGTPFFPLSGDSLATAREGGLAGGGLGCAVLVDEDDPAPYEAKNPLVLFSWLDPLLLPRNTAAVFDDSPLTQLEPALALLRKGASGGGVPSQIWAPRRDRALKNKYIEINRLKSLKYERENTDNNK